MKRLFALMLCAGSLAAQPVAVSPSQLNLGVILETEIDSQLVTVTNTGWMPLTFEAPRFFTYYGNSCYSTQQGPFSVPPQGQRQFWVRFTPEHNIFYDSEMILHSPEAGSYRVDLRAQGAFSNVYYNGTLNLEEEDLKDELNTLLAQNYNDLGYNSARDEMYGDLDNVGGDVTCRYTGRVASFNDRPGANANNFNCEHTYPQSFFSEAAPMKADIHHLFPVDALANTHRSNLPFGVVTGVPTWSNGGSKKGGGVFEPRDEHKGTAARAMMYFVIRYQDYSNFFQGQETILRQWHNQFLPDSAEQDRNDGIYQLQNNRNPFVDYPQFEERITHFVSASASVPSYTHWHTGPIQFTYASQDTAWYSYAWVNTGNRDVHLENFSISGGVQTTASLADTLLEKGQALELKLFVTPANTNLVNAWLEFSRAEDGEDFEIPLTISSSIGLAEGEIHPSAYNNLTIRGVWYPEEALGNYILRDRAGREVSRGRHSAGAAFPVPSVPGIYFLQLQTKKPHPAMRLLVLP